MGKYFLEQINISEKIILQLRQGFIVLIVKVLQHFFLFCFNINLAADVLIRFILIKLT